MAGSALAALLCCATMAAAMNIPPTCGDLAESDIFTLSFAGAHNYLKIDPTQPGFGSLSYRQFSDWNYHEPLFSDVFSIGGETRSSWASLNYTWRPDYAVQSFKESVGGSTIVQGALQVGYLDSYNMQGRLTLQSLSSAATTITLRGAMSLHTTVAMTPFHAGPLQGVSIALNATLNNDWNFPPSLLSLRIVAATSCPGAQVQLIGARDYQITVPLEARASLDCDLVFTLNNFATNRSLADTTADINAWLAELTPPPASVREDALVGMYYQSWFNFWYNTEHAEGYWAGDVITPSKSTYGRAFHIMALIHGGPTSLALAENQVRVLIAGSRISGHLPREVWAGAVSTEIQAPGILTWAALLIYGKTGNLSFIGEVYDALASNNAWYYKTRDPDGNGLCEWEGEDSGWDTSPRWDQGIVEAVDLNAWLCFDQQKLAEMAGLLQRAQEQAQWLQLANTTASLVRTYLWDDAAGVFFDRLPKAKGSGFVRVITPATFWTLFAGIATPVQAARMVLTLTNKTQLAAPYPMPCVGLSEPTFTPTNYWRGPTWINVNYIAFHGLFQYGFTDAAILLRQQTLDIVVHGDATPREYYNPLTGGGLGAYNYMWTGALLIATVNELGN